MTKLFNYIYITATMLALAACHDEPQWDNPAAGNLDALWTIIDEHYCFLDQKGVDWDAAKGKYMAKIKETAGEKGKISQIELFDILAEMLRELDDGHVNLISNFDASRDWVWEEYPENYNERLVNENYLHFDYRRTSGMKYQVIDEGKVGYLRYGSFSSGIGEGNLDAVISYFKDTEGLIIDVRSNGGGYLTNVETLVARFITERLHAGAISHKTGKGHADFSKPYDYYFEPASGRVMYTDKPIIVLANRGSFSATNNFVSIMKSLPQVTVVGDTTGGGCGLPFTAELPIGWSVRFSSAPIYDSDGNLTEWGVDPDIKIDMNNDDIAAGRDPILEKAIELIINYKLN